MNAPDKMKLLTASQNVEVKLSRTKTWGGSETKASYSPADIADTDYARDLGNPGEYPYTRGAYPQMYRSRMWSLRALCGYGAPEDTRDGVTRAMEQGLKGVSIVVDPVTQQYMDPDHPAFGPEVGLDGASIPCVRDMERLLEGIDLTKVDVAWHWGPMPGAEGPAGLAHARPAAANHIRLGQPPAAGRFRTPHHGGLGRIRGQAQPQVGARYAAGLRPTRTRHDAIRRDRGRHGHHHRHSGRPDRARHERR
jgi:Methylmalonyl-CoA mutase